MYDIKFFMLLWVLLILTIIIYNCKVRYYDKEHNCIFRFKYLISSIIILPIFNLFLTLVIKDLFDLFIPYFFVKSCLINIETLINVFNFFRILNIVNIGIVSILVLLFILERIFIKLSNKRWFGNLIKLLYRITRIEFIIIILILIVPLFLDLFNII